MRKLIGVTILTLFTLTIGFCEATVEVVHDDGSYEVGPSGCVGQ